MTPERRHWRRYGVFIVNFEHISLCFSVSIVNFEHVIAGWECSRKTGYGRRRTDGEA